MTPTQTRFNRLGKNPHQHLQRIQSLRQFLTTGTGHHKTICRSSGQQGEPRILHTIPQVPHRPQKNSQSTRLGRSKRGIGSRWKWRIRIPPVLDHTTDMYPRPLRSLGKETQPPTTLSRQLRLPQWGTPPGYRRLGERSNCLRPHNSTKPLSSLSRHSGHPLPHTKGPRCPEKLEDERDREIR